MGKGPTAGSIETTKQTIDSVLRSKGVPGPFGGPYCGYSCKFVSWDDVSRGTVGAELSCWGTNITNTYLKAKNGTPLFVISPDNWNGHVGVVRVSEITLLTGNCDGDNPDLRNVTLLDFLKSPHSNGAGYTRLNPSTSLHSSSTDDKVSIRIQTVFLPAVKSNDNGTNFQFAPEAYNYNTSYDRDPRNLILLATEQGLSVQADGMAKKRLLHHAKSSGVVNEYWLEVEQRVQKFSGEQEEMESDATEQGKEMAYNLGIGSMGKRTNTLMIIQVPLKKRFIDTPISQPPSPHLYSYRHQSATFGPPFFLPPPFKYIQRKPQRYQHQSHHYYQLKRSRHSLTGIYNGDELLVRETDEIAECPPSGLSTNSSGFDSSSSSNDPLLPHPQIPTTEVQGRARSQSSPSSSTVPNAVRVSQGDLCGRYKGLAFTEVERNSNEHITVSVIEFKMFAGGTPSEADIIGAVDDMETLLQTCSKSNRLQDTEMDFMKERLTASDSIEIKTKLQSQPSSMITNPSENELNGDGANKDKEIKYVLDEIEKIRRQEDVVACQLMTLGLMDKQNDTKEFVGIIKKDFENLSLLLCNSSAKSQQAHAQLKTILLMVRGAFVK